MDTIDCALKLTNLPPIMAAMGPHYVSVMPDHLHMEFCGGFDHYGFDIWKKATEWEMTWYTADDEHPILSIPVTDNGAANQPVKSKR